MLFLIFLLFDTSFPPAVGGCLSEWRLCINPKYIYIHTYVESFSFSFSFFHVFERGGGGGELV